MRFSFIAIATLIAFTSPGLAETALVVTFDRHFETIGRVGSVVFEDGAR